MSPPGLARKAVVIFATTVCILSALLEPSSADTPCCQASSPAVNITVTPASDTAVMRGTSDNVTYSCTLSNGSALWQIRGCGSEGQEDRYSYQMVDQDLFLADGVIILNDESGKTSLLNIRPHGQTFLRQQLKSDNITVQCLAVLDDVNVFGGEIYRIEIFGPPSPPLGLSFTSSSSSPSQVMLQWYRPACMSTLVPLNYIVSITDIHTNETVNETYVEVSVPSDMFCRVFSFSVASANSAGTSEPSTIMDTIPPSFTTSNVSLSETVNIRNSSNVEITINFGLAERSCLLNDSYSLNYTATVHGREGSVTVSESPVILSSMNFEPPLTANNNYVIKLTVCNSLICRETEELSIYTTAVQSATVVFFNGSAYLNCTFASYTSATGCLFVFSLPNGNETFTVSRNENSVSSGMCVTTRNTREAYTSIEVYDIESYNSMSSLAITPSVREGGAMESSMCTMDASDIQSAEVEFFETTVLLECTLTTGSTAQGCLFLFSGTGIEAFPVTNSTGYKSCNQTKYERRSDTSVKAYVILYDGNIGSEMVTATVSESSTEPCTLEKDISMTNGGGDGESSGLSAGAAAAVAVFPTAVLMCALGVAIGGLVGSYVAKKRAVPAGSATKSGGELVLEQKTAPHEGGEAEEQMSQ